MLAHTTYVVQHTYIGEAAGSSEMHHRRPIIMMTNRIEDNPREADCSGRALATLVIAWIGAALVASVLLKWTHMWVALAVLTLLFLIACGYAAFDARRTQERAFARAANRQLERRRQREQQLESISSGIDNFPEIIDPPEYQTYWVADSPPSYTAAVGTQTGNGRSPSTIRQEVEEVSGSIQPPRLSNPPPYAVAVQSEPLFIPIIQQSVGIQQNRDMNNTSQISGNGQNIILQTSMMENGSQTTSSHNRLTSGIRINQDKTEEGEESVQNNLTTQSQVPTPPQPPSSRTQYLTSIISSTFVRNMRRANNNNNNNQEHNNNLTLNDRQINNDTINNQSNNNDRNNINNSGIGPPPAYPVTRLSSD